MEDAVYVLRHTNRERAQQKKSAAHKKSGKRSKKVSLPQDKMTRREWSKMNGEVETYRLNKPMKYAKLCEMPRDLQVSYIHSLAEVYEARAKDVCEMLGVTNATLNAQMRRLDMVSPRWCPKKSVSPVWLNFLRYAGEYSAEVKEPPEEYNAPPAPPEEVKQAAPPPSFPTWGKFVFEGPPIAVFEAASRVLNPNEVYEIHIAWQGVSNSVSEELSSPLSRDEEEEDEGWFRKPL